jgi:hypothetical protein
MEARIQTIRNCFKEDKQSFLSSFTSLTKNTDIKEALPKKERAVSKERPPILMNKIRRFKEDSKKNNLKRVPKQFEYHGDIDDYEKELLSRISPKEKEIE